MQYMRLRWLIHITAISLACIFAGVCNAAEEEAAPDWINRQSRVIIGGDILHLGVGEGDSIEVARFKAEAMAVKGLISECSLAHREIIIWDRFTVKLGHGFKGYARAGLAFASCDEAKKARAESRRKLSNPELIKDQEMYSELEGLSPQALKNSKDIEKLGQDLSKIKSDQFKNDNNQLKNSGRLQELEEKVIQLEKSRAAKSETIIIKETKVLYDKAPANQVRYNDCMHDYRQLMNDATTTAYEIGVPKGNLASQGVYQKHNRAEQKLRYCESIKSAK